MSGTATPDRVALLGMMGVGKTSTGSALATRLGWAFVDSDEEIEARTGASGAVLAAREGVAALHRLEARILLDALEAPEPSVIATAASTVESSRCRAALSRVTLVVWLDAPLDVLARRVAAGTHRRPMTPQAALTALEARHRRFAEVADLRLDATAPTGQLVEAIAAELSRGDPASITDRR